MLCNLIACHLQFDQPENRLINNLQDDFPRKCCNYALSAYILTTHASTRFTFSPAHNSERDKKEHNYSNTTLDIQHWPDPGVRFDFVVANSMMGCMRAHRIVQNTVDRTADQYFEADSLLGYHLIGSVVGKR